MAHDVFISYSSQDKAVADAVCARLESRKIRCWIAPRDVPAGQPFAASLINAINTSRVIVLVLSTGSNQSAHVLREVGEAVDNGIPIIPLRIENVEPSEEMRYYIKSLHWLDAMNPPLERHLDKLASSVQALLAVRDDTLPTLSDAEIVAPVQKSQGLPAWAIILIAVIAILILAGGSIWAINRLGSSSQADPTSVSPLTVLETETPLPTTTPGETEWRPLAFTIPNETHLSQTEDSYTTTAKPSDDTIAWSDEVISGDFVLTAEVTHPSQQGEALFIVYGDGISFSYGCLIFNYGGGYTAITKNSIYHEGDNWLVVNTGDYNFNKNAKIISIEIAEGKANLYADGQLVASAILPAEINHAGRIGIAQHWETPAGVTYANIKIKTLDDGE